MIITLLSLLPRVSSCRQEHTVPKIYSPPNRLVFQSLSILTHINPKTYFPSMNPSLRDPSFLLHFQFPIQCTLVIGAPSQICLGTLIECSLHRLAAPGRLCKGSQLRPRCRGAQYSPSEGHPIVTTGTTGCAARKRGNHFLASPSKRFTDGSPQPINFLSLLHPSSSPPYHLFVSRIIKSSDQQASIFLQQKLKIADSAERAKIIDAICARGFEMMAHR